MSKAFIHYVISVITDEFLSRYIFFVNRLQKCESVRVMTCNLHVEVSKLVGSLNLFNFVFICSQEMLFRRRMWL